VPLHGLPVLDRYMGN